MRSIKSSRVYTLCFSFILTFAFVTSNCPAKCKCTEERKGHLGAIHDIENYVVDCSHRVTKSSKFTSIPDFDPEESFSTWKLIMTGNELGSIPSGAVKNLTELKELDLSNCGISEIKETSFAGPSRLEKLILKDNLIANLPEHTFHHHSPALMELILAGNRLTLDSFIKAGKYLINLRTLDLSRNGIRSDGNEMPADFKHLTSLRYLDLSYNAISTMADNFFLPFKTLVQLKTLDLSFNNLRPSINTLANLPLCLEDLNLAGNPHLGIQDNLRNTLYGIPNNIDIRVLNLSSVGLSGALQAKAFDFVRKLNLEVLDISNNRITELNSPDLSSKMPYIKEMHIANNRLTSIKSLAQMEGLQTLDLSNNTLRTFPVEIFHMPDLEELFLCKNSMKRISVNSSYNEPMNALWKLDLSRNKLSTLLVNGNTKLWRQFPRLRELNLAFNSLSNVDPMNMQSLGELETLDLRQNRFSQIHNNLYSLINKLKSLQEVKINGNPFQCTCRWLEEAQRAIPPSVSITGLAATLCRTDDIPVGHAPTVAGFADATCNVHLPGTPKIKASKKSVNEPVADASIEKPSGTTTAGLSPGITALIVLIVIGAVIGVGILVWKQGHRVKGHFMGGPMSYTEILDEYHPPNGGGVPL